MSLPPSVAGKEVCVANVLVFTLCQPWRRAALAAGETFRQEALAFVLTPADTAITLQLHLCLRHREVSTHNMGRGKSNYLGGVQENN